MAVYDDTPSRHSLGYLRRQEVWRRIDREQPSRHLPLVLFVAIIRNEGTPEPLYEATPR